MCPGALHLQNGQVFIEFPFGDLCSVLIPLGVSAFDEGVKGAFAEGLADEFAAFGTINGLPRLAGRVSIPFSARSCLVDY